MRTGFACLRVSGRGDVAEAEQQKVRLCPHLQGAVHKDQGESGTRCCGHSPAIGEAVTGRAGTRSWKDTK